MTVFYSKPSPMYVIPPVVQRFGNHLIDSIHQFIHKRQTIWDHDSLITAPNIAKTFVMKPVDG